MCWRDRANRSRPSSSRVSMRSSTFIRRFRAREVSDRVILRIGIRGFLPFCQEQSERMGHGGHINKSPMTLVVQNAGHCEVFLEGVTAFHAEIVERVVDVGDRNRV